MGATASVLGEINEIPIEQAAEKLYHTEAYYVDDNSPITTAQVDAAKAAWHLITENQAPKYLELKNSNQISVVCEFWFYERFFVRLTELDEAADFTFNSVLKGKIQSVVEDVMQMLASFNEAEQANWLENAKQIAVTHHADNVQAYQYVIIGNCLFWTFENCLGELWTEDAKAAWYKIYSTILKSVVPKSLDLERQPKAADKAATPATIRPPRPSMKQSSSASTKAAAAAANKTPDTSSKRQMFHMHSTSRIANPEDGDAPVPELVDPAAEENDTASQLAALTHANEN